MSDDNNTVDMDTSKPPDRNIDINETKHSGLNINSFATQKTISIGGLNLALLMSNAEQIRYLTHQATDNDPFYYVGLTMLSISIILQVINKVMCIIIGTSTLSLSSNDGAKMEKIIGYNRAITIISLVITVINVLVNAVSTVGNEKANFVNKTLQ